MAVAAQQGAALEVLAAQVVRDRPIRQPLEEHLERDYTLGAAEWRIDAATTHGLEVLGCSPHRVVVESEQPMVIERIAVSYDPFETRFGTIGVVTPSSRWMFADGGTDGELDTFYLAFNPGPDPVEATFTYRTPSGVIALPTL